MEKLEIKTFSNQKNDGIFHILIQGSGCKSGIAIFAWRVIRNYATSPFWKNFKSFILRMFKL